MKYEKVVDKLKDMKAGDLFSSVVFKWVTEDGRVTRAIPIFKLSIVYEIKDGVINKYGYFHRDRFNWSKQPVTTQFSRYYNKVIIHDPVMRKSIYNKFVVGGLTCSDEVVRKVSKDIWERIKNGNN
jgi:hypothetical protein